jgi:1,4-dihydroxy-2-naphthoate octaprenyltransferase
LIIKNSSRFKLWLSAARLRTLPLSVSGVFIGSFATISSNDFNFYIFILAFSTTISYQILSNFANDYGDGVKGTDLNRIGPKRLVQTGLVSSKEMLKAIIITSIISLFLTILLVFISFKDEPLHIIYFLALGLLSIFAAIKYTVGNNAYGYSGLGDLFVFIFFGLISVLGSNFLFTSKFNFSLLYPALTIGILSVGVLNLNNMRDIENDKVVGKKTLVVRLGLNNSKFYHSLLISTSVIFMILFLIKVNSYSIVFILLMIVNIVCLAFDLLRIYKVKEPEKFDHFLKPLVFSTIFYSISLCFGFAYLF